VSNPKRMLPAECKSMVLFAQIAFELGQKNTHTGQRDIRPKT